MKKKILLLICMVMVATVVFTACSGVNDDTGLRKDGYNIVVTYDCGKYLNQTVTSNEDAQIIQYGDTHVDDRSNFIAGNIGIEGRSVRTFYYKDENVAIIQPGAIKQVAEPTLAERVFMGWYVATVVEYKLDDNGTPLKNKWGQFEYGKVVPQETDVKWDFANNTVGSYAEHPSAITKYVYDATQAFDAQVTVGGQTVTNGTEYTDEQLGYSAETGYNIYLYAKWNVKPKFIIQADVNGDGTWDDVLKLDPIEETGKMQNRESDIKQTGYTFYKLYLDKNFENAWDYNMRYQDLFTGTEDSLRPYVTLYAKFIQGEWSVVRTVGQLNSAVYGNKNIYLDADITFSGNTTWIYSSKYSAKFNGNNHVITFENVMDNPTDRNTINYGLFGTFSGEMRDVEFVNVTINMKSYPVQTSVNCGVLAGLISAEATFSNVKISGKVVYSDTIRERANVENAQGKIVLTIYRGDETDIDADSWYGVKSGEVTGVTYVNTANTENSGDNGAAE